MPDAATVRTNGSLGRVSAGDDNTLVVTAGGSIVYGIGWRVTVAGQNDNHNHTIRVQDTSGRVLLVGTVSSKINSAGSVFQVPVLLEGIRINWAASSASYSPEIDWVLWTDGSHVRATEQQ